LWPNYIFADMTGNQYHEAVSIKHLRATVAQLGAFAIRDLTRHKTSAEAALAAAQRDVERGKAIQEEYNPGQALRVLSGPFGEALVRYRRIVENGQQIEVEMDLMGQGVLARFDPLDLKKEAG
ncbi:MAG: hypothetical protein ACPGFA_12145, partial [Pikeienuella sp.]